MSRRKLMGAIAALGVSFALGAIANADETFEPGQPIRYDGCAIVTISPTNEVQAQAVRLLELRLMSCAEGRTCTDYLVTSGEMAVLRSIGVPLAVVTADVQAAIDEERARLERAGDAPRGSAWFEEYKTRDQIVTFFDELVAQRPDVITQELIGMSLEGREIYAYELTGPGGEPDRPALLFNGTQHAREWISPMTLSFFARELVTGYGEDPEVTALLDGVKYLLVPIVNPDGYVYSWTTDRMWRKNRRDNGDGSFGVDPNRNWSFEWGGRDRAAGADRRRIVGRPRFPNRKRRRCGTTRWLTPR